MSGSNDDRGTLLSEGWRRALDSHANAIATVLAVAVTLPSLRLGFVLDDYLHAAYVQTQQLSAKPEPWNLFTTFGPLAASSVPSRIADGTLPWWTWPQLSIAFFRPLAAASHWIDHTQWPDQPWLMHAENIVLYLCIVLLVGKLYRRTMGEGTLAGLALILYSVDEAHSEGAAWIASRNTLLTAVFVLLALSVHTRQRQSTGSRKWWIAPSCLLLGFASSEGAIAIWGFLVGYALFIPDSWRERRNELRALIPMAAVTLCWQALYRFQGYGVRGSGLYRDPFDAPWYFFVHRMPETLATLTQEQFGLPSAPLLDLGVAASKWHTALQAIVGGALLAILIALAVRDRKLGFWLAGYAGAALPVAATLVGPRLLFLPGVAGFALLAFGFREGIARLRSTRPLVERVLVAVILGALACIHGPLALYYAPQGARAMKRFEQYPTRFAHAMPPAARDCSRTVFILNTPDYYMTALSPFYAGPTGCPRVPYIFGASLQSVKLTRVASDAIELMPLGGYMLEPTSSFLRAPELPFVPGQAIRNGPMRVVIEDVTADGRPRRVRFEAVDLVDPGRIYVAWRGQAFDPIRLPNVGQSLLLPLH